MSSIKGYPSNEKLDADQMAYMTVNPIGGQRHGIDVVAQAYVSSVGTDAAEAGTTNKVINATGHAAKVGMLIRMTSGNTSGEEVFVQAVDANTITLAQKLSEAPAGADTFQIFRFTYGVVDSGGGIASALSFTRDGGSQTVIEDTGTPANNRPLPVKMMDFDGPVNIESTNLHLNVQLDHDSANPDSVQIGDGTEIMLVNADGSINTVISDGGGSITVDGTVNVGNFPASQTVDDGGSSLTVDNAELTSLDGKAVQEALDFGADAGAKRTAAQIGNASGAADFGSGVEGAQTLRTTPATDAEHLLNTRHEAMATPLSVRLSDGANAFATQTVGNSQLSENGNTPALQVAAFGMGFDDINNTHKEFQVSSEGRILTSDTELSSVELVRNDYTSTGITTGAYTQVVASTSAAIRQLHIFDSSGEGIILSTGAAASEVDVLYIPPGGFNSPINLYIASGTRLSIKALTADVTVGTAADFIMTCLG